MKKKEWVYQIQSRISTANGASKCNQGVLKAVNDKPACVTIWRRFQLHGKVCIFDEIDDYIEKTKTLHESIPNFFLTDTYFGAQWKTSSRSVF